MELEVNDLATLPDLNEDTLLCYLKARYKHDVIYVSWSNLFNIKIFKLLKIFLNIFRRT